MCTFKLQAFCFPSRLVEPRLLKPALPLLFFAPLFLPPPFLFATPLEPPPSVPFLAASLFCTQQMPWMYEYQEKHY